MRKRLGQEPNPEPHPFFLKLAEPGLNYSMWDLPCGMWNLVPWPGIELWPLALGAWSLSHWTTREVPITPILNKTHCVAAPGPIWAFSTQTLPSLGRGCPARRDTQQRPTVLPSNFSDLLGLRLQWTALGESCWICECHWALNSPLMLPRSEWDTSEWPQGSGFCPLSLGYPSVNASNNQFRE